MATLPVKQTTIPAVQTFFVLVSFVFLLIASSSSSLAGGALCLYTNGAGEVVCSVYSNSGLTAEANCAAEARASNPSCGSNMAAINVAAGSCASQIFVSPARCLDNVAPHNITGSLTQATCEAAGDRWCPSTYYGFFVGNSGCQTAICAAGQDILPVELIDFIGYEEGSVNHLTWTTASEQNNDYFLLEQSLDGENWNAIALIPGAGNSTEIRNYRAIHMAPEKSLNYYRLHQVDYDGASKTYNPVAIDNRDEKRKVVNVVNMIGQSVDENYSGVVIVFYSDGTHEKTIQKLLIE